MSPRRPFVASRPWPNSHVGSVVATVIGTAGCVTETGGFQRTGQATGLGPATVTARCISFPGPVMPFPPRYKNGVDVHPGETTVVTDLSPLAARVESCALDIAASGGDIFHATSVILAIVGAGGRSVVEEAATDLRRPRAADPADDTVSRALFLLEEMLRLRVWITS